MIDATPAQLEKEEWEKTVKFWVNRRKAWPMLQTSLWLKNIYALVLKIEFFSDNADSNIWILLHIILSMDNDTMYHDFDTI
jgi:hypothetical protein